MGCDIHLHIEVKIRGEWQHYAAPHVGRSYILFGKMAGVRSDEVDPIALPRGLPADVSVLTRFTADDYGNDGHSHSWLSASELVELEAFVKETLKQDLEVDLLNCYLFGNSFAGFTQYPDSNPDGLEDVRFVFWFDN